MRRRLGKHRPAPSSGCGWRWRGVCFQSHVRRSSVSRSVVASARRKPCAAASFACSPLRRKITVLDLRFEIHLCPARDGCELNRLDATADGGALRHRARMVLALAAGSQEWLTTVSRDASEGAGAEADKQPPDRRSKALMGSFSDQATRGTLSITAALRHLVRSATRRRRAIEPGKKRQAAVRGLQAELFNRFPSGRLLFLRCDGFEMSRA